MVNITNEIFEILSSEGFISNNKRKKVNKFCAKIRIIVPSDNSFILVQMLLETFREKAQTSLFSYKANYFLTKLIVITFFVFFLDPSFADLLSLHDFFLIPKNNAKSVVRPGVLIPKR